MRVMLLTLLLSLTWIPAPAMSESQGHNHSHHTSTPEQGEPETAPAWFKSKPAEGEYFTCPVSGGIFEVESHTRMAQHDGRYYAFCCGGCAQDFTADPERYAGKHKLTGSAASEGPP